MEGNLVHTNEILVLLGDNWFVDRSAFQATDIIKRRIKGKFKIFEHFVLVFSTTIGPTTGHVVD